jgi:ribosomal protein L3 glutamine methyltransferase
VTDTAQFSELVTVRDFLRFAVSRFQEAGLSYGHGTTSALDDAAFLILETLHLPVDSLEPWLDARLTRAERLQIGGIIEQRVVSRQPSAYLTGSAYIGPHRFSVDPRVIVPRSFIGELLLEDDALPFGLEMTPARVLDLCTGSGCLAIVAAHRFPEAAVWGSDLSREAIAVAKDNVARHGLAERVRLIVSDGFQALGGEMFDLILCNPPYVTAAAVAAFPAEYKAEPVLAHLGGSDGMDLVRRLLTEASAYLAPDGALVMEIGAGRRVIEQAFSETPFMWLETEHSSGEVFVLAAADLPVAGKRSKQPPRKAKLPRRSPSTSGAP